jgi:hypothetical protein
VPARETEGGRHPALVREAGWDPPVTYVTRERETAAACEGPRRRVRVDVPRRRPELGGRRSVHR